MWIGFSLEPDSEGWGGRAGSVGSACAWGFAGGFGARFAPRRTGYILACHKVNWTSGIGHKLELRLSSKRHDGSMHCERLSKRTVDQQQ